MLGGRDRDRTGDPLLAKQVLSQLSYTPTRTVPDSKTVWLVANRKPLLVFALSPRRYKSKHHNQRESSKSITPGRGIQIDGKAAGWYFCFSQLHLEGASMLRKLPGILALAAIWMTLGAVSTISAGDDV